MINSLLPISDTTVATTSNIGKVKPDGLTTKTDQDGTIHATETRELTQAQFDALPQEEKDNGTTYFIPDGHGEGNVSELNDLTDVDITSAAEGDLLQYDATGQNWVNSAKIPQKVAGLQKTGCVNFLPNELQSQVSGGITITVNDDGTFIANGTNTSGNALEFRVFRNISRILKTGETYRLTGTPAGGTANTYFLGIQSTCWQHRAPKGETFTYGSNSVNVNFYVTPGAVLNNVLIKPMISLEEMKLEYDDYQPYSMTNRELTDEFLPLGTFTCKINAVNPSALSNGWYTWTKNYENIPEFVSAGISSGARILSIVVFNNGNNHAFIYVKPAGSKLQFYQLDVSTASAISYVELRVLYLKA